MAEIYKPEKQKKIAAQAGFALLASLIIMSLLLLLAVYLINFTLTEIKIANSQSTAAKTYYLAESGIAEAIWRLKNDAAWKNNFESNPAWTVDYVRQPALYSNGSYRIQIINSGLAKGSIIATGKLQVGDSVAQRVVKTTVYKALGDSIVEDSAEYADGNIDISGGVVNVFNGSLFSNGNVIINFWSTLNVDNLVKAAGNINKNWTATINAAGLMAQNYPPAPTVIAMPPISFNTAGDAQAYKARADQIYSQAQFENLMKNNRDLTLNGIIYVTGDIEIKGDQNLTVNGALVAEGNIYVGKNTLLCCWGLRCGRSNLTINQPAEAGQPSGLLAKGKINFELCLEDLNIRGLVYANDQLNVLSIPGSYNILGGVISRKFSLSSIWQGINIVLDPEIVNNTLGSNQYSPVVTVDHWEEEY